MVNHNYQQNFYISPQQSHTRYFKYNFLLSTEILSMYEYNLNVNVMSVDNQTIGLFSLTILSSTH